MIEWLVAGLGIGAGLGGAWFAVARGRLAATLRSELDHSRAELEATRERTSRKGDAERRRDEELAELRRRLEKAKRRAGQVRSEEKQESERLRALEDQLRLAQADLRVQRDEIGRLEVELGRARRPAGPPPPMPVAPDPAPESKPDAELREALSKRAEAAEARALGLEDALVRARTDIERLRRRAGAQEKLYAALRGELDAKKERLRTQQEELERLRALRLVLADDLREPEA